MISVTIKNLREDLNYNVGKHVYYFCELSCGHIKFLRKDQAVRRTTYCECCSTKELSRQANQSDCLHIPLDIFGKDRQELYLFPCGHNGFRLRQSVKKQQFKCQICFDEIVRKRCRDFGVDFLYKKKNIVSAKLPCGHKVDFSLPKLTSQKSIPCTVCLDNLHKERGLIPVFGKNNTYNFVSCGHEQKIGSREVRVGAFWCRTCRINNFKREAESVGIEYVGLASTKAKRLYRLPCGCLKEIQLAKVRLGSFTCHEHDVTHYSLPSKVYLFSVSLDNEIMLKLGVSANPELRHRGYGLPDFAESSLVYAANFPTGQQAFDFERALHAELKDRKICPAHAKKYFSLSGHTECYPPNLLDFILDKMKNHRQEYLA